MEDSFPAKDMLVIKSEQSEVPSAAVSSSCFELIGIMSDIVPDSQDKLFSTEVVWDAEYGG